MLQTGGTWYRRAHRATVEATPVTRLKRAGFVVMACTTIPELGMWFESESQHQLAAS